MNIFDALDHFRTQHYQNLEKTKDDLQKALSLRAGEIGQISRNLEPLLQQLGVSATSVSTETDKNEWFTSTR